MSELEMTLLRWLEEIAVEVDDAVTIVKTTKADLDEALEDARRAEVALENTRAKVDRILSDPALPDWKKPGAGDCQGREAGQSCVGTGSMMVPGDGTCEFCGRSMAG